MPQLVQIETWFLWIIHRIKLFKILGQYDNFTIKRFVDMRPQKNTYCVDRCTEYCAIFQEACWV